MANIDWPRPVAARPDDDTPTRGQKSPTTIPARTIVNVLDRRCPARPSRCSGVAPAPVTPVRSLDPARTPGGSMSAVSTPAQPESTAQRPSGVVVDDRRVTVDGITAQYLEAGTGPTVLLLHGHEHSASSWRWVIPALARTHRVLALSLPGHGDTAQARAYTPGSDTAPFVAAFLDTLGVGPLHVVGHSAGGALALRLALADPARDSNPGPGRQRRARTRGAPPARRGHPAPRRRAGDPAQSPARRQHGPHHDVRRDAVRPTLAGTRRLPHRAARPRTPPRPARSLHRHGPRPVRRHRTTPDPARPAPRRHRAHPGRLGRM